QRGAILVAAWVDDGHVDRALATYREYGAAAPDACEPRGADHLAQQVRVRAYHLWEQAGRPDGRDLEFWHQARHGMTGEDGEAAPRSESLGSPTSQYRHHDATPGSAPDRSVQAAVPDTFPASDPMATTAAVGSRAADPAALMDARGEVEVRDAATVVAHFPDQERAKLALEGLVRDVPLDRRCGTISCDGGQATLKVTAPGADAARVAEILRRCGGQGC
ncbi:DUF2934 domain-containing protein, partial [Paracraurococcus lichenis]